MLALTRPAAVLAIGLCWALLGVGPAQAESTTVPGAVNTSAFSTSSMTIAVPDGVTPSAITGVLTMPQIINGGTVEFRVNGRVVKSIASTLYAKVSLPVTRADVIANGTMALTVRSLGPFVEAAGCRPTAGAATFRKVALTYRGTETAPTTLAQFFPPSSTRLDVVIPTDADQALEQAGLAAVAALSSRYPDGTDIRLTPASDAPIRGKASQRIVAFETGRAGEITSDVTTAPGRVPTLTIAATGDDLAAAARALALDPNGDTLALADDPNLNGLTSSLGTRDPALEQSLADLGLSELSPKGYGTVSHVLRVPQDAFSSPITAIDVHLEGAYSAVADPNLARLDVRMNGELVGSQALDQSGLLEMDFAIAEGRLRSINTMEFQLNALTPTGQPCAPAGTPTIEVNIDTDASTLTATAGTTNTRTFQTFPQVLQSSLPVAVRTEGGQRFAALQNAARLVSALQHASAYPLSVQIVPTEAFIADDRSGLFVGATTDDAASLKAPLKLSSIRVLDRADSSFQVTSQEPYSALESFLSEGRQVLMLGSWAPGNTAAPAKLSNAVTNYVVKTGWGALEGDVLLTDSSGKPFAVDSLTLQEDAAAEDDADDERSYAKYFIGGVALLMVILAAQVIASVRRDRLVAAGDAGNAGDQDDVIPAQAAYLEDLEFREQYLSGQPERPANKKSAPKPKKSAPSAAPKPAKKQVEKPAPPKPDRDPEADEDRGESPPED